MRMWDIRNDDGIVIRDDGVPTGNLTEEEARDYLRDNEKDDPGLYAVDEDGYKIESADGRPTL